MAANIVVSLGTDHHHFERLLIWVETWAAQNEDVSVFVQHGHTRPPRVGDHVDLLARDELVELYKSATVVVTQGGPGSILDVASIGKAPIVVPRIPELDEVVDGHQVAFSRYIASIGTAVVAEDYDTFAAELSAGIAQPLRLAREPRKAPVEQTAAVLDQVVAEVVSRPAGFIRWSRFRRAHPAAAHADRGRVPAPIVSQLDRPTG